MNEFLPSPELVAYVKVEEGKRLQAYRCPAGVWTIGYGHTSAAGVPAVNPGMAITEREAHDILVRDLTKVYRGVKALVTVPLKRYQMDALASFVFNVGLPKFKNSTLLRVLNQGRYDDVPAQLMRWANARNPRTGEMGPLPGLVKRRRAECEIWRGLRWGEPQVEFQNPTVIEEQARVEPEPPPAKPITQSREAKGAFAGLGAVFIWIYAEFKELLDAHADLVTTIVTNPRLLIPLLLVGVLGLIIYFRKQRAEEGV